MTALARVRMPTLDEIRIERDKRACAVSLAEFVRRAWHVLEPATEYVHGRHIEALCDHLEAVTRGDVTRLLINVPPGSSKSLIVSVFWPAWEWGPAGGSGRCAISRRRIMKKRHAGHAPHA